MQRSRHRSAQHSYPRSARVNALLLEVLAEEIERLADGDERLTMLTLTDVACEPGLRHATVYLASLSEEAAAGLEEHRRVIQASVATQVRMKRTPSLTFVVDPAVTAGAAVDEALRRASKRTPYAGPSAAGQAGAAPTAEEEANPAEGATPERRRLDRRSDGAASEGLERKAD